MEIILMGLATATGVILLLHKLDIRKVAFFGAPVDIIVSLGLFVMLAGTVSGAAAAVIAGIVVSAYILFSRNVFGVKRPTLKGWEESRPALIKSKKRRIDFNAMEIGVAYRVERLK